MKSPLDYTDIKGVILVKGDYVEATHTRIDTVLGKPYQLHSCYIEGDLYYIDEAGDHNFGYWDMQKCGNVSQVILGEGGDIEVVQQTQSPLSTRKDNKIKMELVETGFPNALLVLGQVMTWASVHKGYLPNDWKNIPNPQDAFLGAASRHRMERMKGIGEDDESGLPHLAHEAFNVLAQLELLITGKLV